jgi:hypothetical protein
MMNRAFTNIDGNVSVVTFAPEAKRDKETEEEFMDRIWAKLRKDNPDYPEDFIDTDTFPDRLDADGVPCRVCWAIKDGAVVIDKTKRNRHREIFDKEKEIEVLVAKDSPTNREVLDVRKKEQEIRVLKKELGGR